MKTSQEILSSVLKTTQMGQVGKIRDVDYREMPGIPGSTSLRKAWSIMRDSRVDTLSQKLIDTETNNIRQMRPFL